MAEQSKPPATKPRKKVLVVGAAAVATAGERVAKEEPTREGLVGSLPRGEEGCNGSLVVGDGGGINMVGPFAAILCSFLLCAKRVEIVLVVVVARSA